MGYHYVDDKKIRKTLFNETDYLTDFCEAGVISITEFKENFRKHLLNRNLEDLKKAGHKITPGAQIMGVNEIVTGYERAKQMLENDAGQQALEDAAQKMDEICTSVCNDLDLLKKSLS